MHSVLKQWRHRRGVLQLERPLVMGIVNVTPDSFSDGGRFGTVSSAVACALQYLQEGADIVDVGGESTRPGFVAVSAEVEMARVLPVIEALRGKDAGIVISVDTSKAVVAESALKAGADIVNDVSALTDEGMAEVVRTHGAGVVLMHHASVNIHHSSFTISKCVAEGLREHVEFALEAGIARECICVDPGFGFGKKWEENWELLEGLEEIVALGYPMLVGGSRKHFLGMRKAEGGAQNVECRMQQSVDFAAEAIRRGAHIVRVHDVAQTRERVAR